MRTTRRCGAPETGTLIVTGAAGFVMSNLVRRFLLDHPRARAVAVDAADLDGDAERWFAPVRDRLDPVRGDVLDPDLWRRVGERADVRWMVHGAAVTSIERDVHAEGPGRPGLAGARRSVEANVLGTLDALAFAGRLPALERFVNVSSGAVYASDGPDPLPEDGWVEPDGLYPVTKLAGEMLTAYAARNLGLRALSVRLSGVYGPMDRATATRVVRCAPRAIAEWARAGETVTVRSLEGAGDFIHADDVARAIVALIEAPAPAHAVYNVAAGRLASIGDLVAILSGRFPALGCTVVREGPVDVDYPADRRRARYGAYDIARIRADTGWAPRPLEEALLDYADWIAAEPRP